ncbi:MFS transporter [Arenibacter palladensis]|uniref:MFS transporter n=1 Tax=Arenibacter palladensis TaxID=237373 RepID=UPI0026E36643|nr:MFS transporter [Arenibacter palladensis]MDO6602230.1 MFS transporter [Arenibacter palladensis]
MKIAYLKTHNAHLWLLSMSSLLFSASYNILLPELPVYLIGIGGESYLGFIILLFTISALLARPLSGRLSDSKGGKFTIYIGLCVTLLVNLLYPWVTFISGFLLLRFLHGFSTGFAPTGYTFYAKGNFKNRGKAISIQSAFYSAGMAIGPMFSSWIHTKFGMDYVFYSGAILGLLAFLMILPLKEKTTEVVRTNEKSNLWIDIQIWRQSLVMFWVFLGFGILLVSSSLRSISLGFQNNGIFFIFFTLSTILIRLIIKNRIDVLPLKQLLIYGTILLIISSGLFSIWSHKIAFVLASIVYGAAMGIFIPSLNLWVLNDNAGADGKALSTLYIFMELGIGLGSLLIGKLIIGFQSAFMLVFLVYGIISFALPIFFKTETRKVLLD